MKDWFRIVFDAAKDPTSAEIHITDIIGGWIDELWGGGSGVVTAKGFLADLSALPETVKSIKVHINSPGGDVFGGVQIAQALRSERLKGRSVETIVDGLAASSASVVAMAGSPLTMSDTAILMIHNPSSYAFGNAAEMRTVAEELDKIRDAALIPAYQWHSTKDPQEIAALMDATTWMDADEAIEMGFADRKVEGLKAAASIDRRVMARLAIPEQYIDRVTALVAPVEDVAIPAVVVPDSPKVQSADPLEVLALCTEAGLDIAFARQIVSDAGTIESARQRVATETAARQAEASRVAEIRAVCAKVGQEDLSEEYVAGHMSPDQVRAHMLKIRAKLDAVELDSTLNPDHGKPRGVVIDVRDVYARMNGLLPAQK